MKAIIIADNGWISSLPKRARPDAIKLVFSLANQTGYDIKVSGQHWS